jgi:murein DD-endopeptidase MepM/ murein hydrolase activator NlpD
LGWKVRSLRKSIEVQKQPPPQTQAPPPPYIWPAQGPISNTMTAKHPLGIDIGLVSYPDSPIKASKDGRVVFAGGAACCSYGLYVIVSHGDVDTVYAHLSQIIVAEGDEVKQGQTVGISGATGRSTAEHLHFEVRRGDERLDPMQFLPSPCPGKDGLYPIYAMPGGNCALVPEADGTVRAP